MRSCRITDNDFQLTLQIQGVLMAINDYFGMTYPEARAKFLAVAEASEARLTAHELPGLRGPDGEALTVDVATIGPDDPKSVLLLISGTHGVEGLCGSGCQVGFFADRLHEALPEGTRSIVVHGLNPHGFAWLRRVNEDNVDLNRNFHDFAEPLPASPDYEEIHDWLIPADWDGPGRQAADAALQRYIREWGIRRVQAAVSAGQYTRPGGLYYGGVRESWSAATFRQILRAHVPATATKVAVLDIHTGLGPGGYGEPIHLGLDEAAFERARRWYGPEVTDPLAGTSTSSALSGSLDGAFGDLESTAEVTFIALEFGTKPIFEVLTALRADHWLHAVPDRRTPLREGIKRQMRDAFFIDNPAWKAAVYGRVADFVLRASRGLSDAVRGA
jgi:hypothetical protein